MNSPGPRLLLALYEPDIAQNAGAMMRTCACLGVDAAIIEPAGFRIGDSRFRRGGHGLSRRGVGRPTQFVGEIRGVAQGFRPQARAPDDQGRDRGSGTSPSVRATSCSSAGNRLECRTRWPSRRTRACRIPIRPPLRSLNVGIAATIALVEALRQIDGLP